MYARQDEQESGEKKNRHEGKKFSMVNPYVSRENGDIWKKNPWSRRIARYTFEVALI